MFKYNTRFFRISADLYDKYWNNMYLELLNTAYKNQKSLQK